MTGVAWFVQLVHYPLFAAVGRASFPPYQRDNIRRTAMLVIPVMAIESGACLSLLLAGRTAATVIGAGLLLAIWAISVGLHLPQHMRLASAFDEGLHKRLLKLNWLRTLAWTTRLALAIWMAA